jgi:hypothetical protein
VRHVVDVLKLLCRPAQSRGGGPRTSLKIEKRPASALKQRFTKLLTRDDGTSTVSDTFSDDSTSQSASHSFVRPAKYVGVRASANAATTTDSEATVGVPIDASLSRSFHATFVVCRNKPMLLLQRCPSQTK